MFVKRFKEAEDVKKAKQEEKTNQVMENKLNETNDENETRNDEKPKQNRFLDRFVANIPSLLLYDETQYVVDRIDEVARKVFPSSFLLTVFCYWTYYIHLAEDLRAGPQLRSWTFLMREVINKL